MKALKLLVLLLLSMAFMSPLAKSEAIPLNVMLIVLSVLQTAIFICGWYYMVYLLTLCTVRPLAARIIAGAFLGGGYLVWLWEIYL